jgi:hypothetical protein
MIQDARSLRRRPGRHPARSSVGSPGIGGITLMIIAPFVFFPFSKTLFLAFDLVFRPAAEVELTPPADPGR